MRVFKENMGVFGARKVWLVMNREGIPVARCTVERLMREMGIHGVHRGRQARTTIPDGSDELPGDRVHRDFSPDAPNRLWVADFTYVSTWLGWAYVAFVIDAFARRVLGWSVSASDDDRLRAGRPGTGHLGS
jgi:putative transposase